MTILANANVIMFLVNKATKEVPYAGRVPGEYQNMTGLQGMTYDTIRDLSCLGHPELGFMTYEDARALSVPAQTLDNMKAAAIDIEWNALAPEREARIQAIRWRIDRNSDEIAMAIPVTEPVMPLLEYVQAIRDLPTGTSNPFDIVWPQIPPLP